MSYNARVKCFIHSSRVTTNSTKYIEKWDNTEKGLEKGYGREKRKAQRHNAPPST